MIDFIVPQRRKPDPRYPIQLADRDLSGKTYVLPGRKPSHGQAVIDELAARSGTGRADFETCEVSSLESVKASARRNLLAHDRIDVAITCAGINATTRIITEHGLGLNRAVSYFGPYLLTRLLPNRLTGSAPARIVSLPVDTVVLHRLEMDGIATGPDLATSEPYIESKLSIKLAAIDLAQHLDGTGVTVNSLHPGNNRSNLLRHLTGCEGVAGAVMRTMASPTGAGADRIMQPIVSSGFEGVTGTFLHEDTIRAAHPEAPIAINRMRRAEATKKVLRDGSSTVELA